MARKFTRIEFEGDTAVVITHPESDGGYVVKGNHASGIGSFTGFKGMMYKEVINKVIERVGKTAKRRLTHTISA